MPWPGRGKGVGCNQSIAVTNAAVGDQLNGGLVVSTLVCSASPTARSGPGVMTNGGRCEGDRAVV